MTEFRYLDPLVRQCLLSNCPDLDTLQQLAQVDRGFHQAFLGLKVGEPSGHPRLARLQREWWLCAIRERSQQTGLQGWGLGALHREFLEQRAAARLPLPTRQASDVPTITLADDVGGYGSIFPSPDGRWAAVTGMRGLTLVHISGEAMTPVRLPPEARTNLDNSWEALRDVAFSPCGGYFAALAISRLSIWRLEAMDGDYAATLQYVEATPGGRQFTPGAALTFSADGQHLAAAGGAFGIQVWRDWATPAPRPVWGGRLPNVEDDVHCYFPIDGGPLELHLQAQAPECLRAYDLRRSGKRSFPRTPGVMHASYAARRAPGMHLLIGESSVMSFGPSTFKLLQCPANEQVDDYCFMPAKTKVLALWGRGQLSLVPLRQ